MDETDRDEAEIAGQEEDIESEYGFLGPCDEDAGDKE
jgi:hypothetical protein